MWLWLATVVDSIRKVDSNFFDELTLTHASVRQGHWVSSKWYHFGTIFNMKVVQHSFFQLSSIGSMYITTNGRNLLSQSMYSPLHDCECHLQFWAVPETKMWSWGLWESSTQSDHHGNDKRRMTLTLIKNRSLSYQHFISNSLFRCPENFHNVSVCKGIEIQAGVHGSYAGHLETHTAADMFLANQPKKNTVLKTSKLPTAPGTPISYVHQG